MLGLKKSPVSLSIDEAAVEWGQRVAQNTLNAAVVEALANATVRLRLAGLGEKIFSPDQQTPESLAVLHKGELEKWWPIIKAANIKTE